MQEQQMQARMDGERMDGVVQGTWLKNEREYLPKMKELLAVKNAIVKFPSFLQGNPVHILSDSRRTVAYINHQGGHEIPLSDVGGGGDLSDCGTSFDTNSVAYKGEGGNDGFRLAFLYGSFSFARNTSESRRLKLSSATDTLERNVRPHSNTWSCTLRSIVPAPEENFNLRDSDVCVVFKDFETLQNVCNMLVEKLSSSVCISSPQFYHSPENMETLRRQVCLNAVSNARRKAQEVCRLVGQSLGKAILIKEEEMKEWEDQADCASSSIQHRIKGATVYAMSKVSATFEIKGKERIKKIC
ncbi:unnamed protein product [Ranitomeya imitator]|uniref:Uncharacterized protein n=1 Tax=Ranitomeya imitator TaxID=111125 RepID=A0ABN9KTI5_9NEOB|nr:unnamed protein product [Ranitomeya imitator]